MDVLIVGVEMPILALTLIVAISVFINVKLLVEAHEEKRNVREALWKMAQKIRRK